MADSNIIFLFLTIAISTAASLDLQSYMLNIQDLFHPRTDSSSVISLDNIEPDEVTAVVGRLFTYELPKDTVSVKDQVLPEWLSFNEEMNKLQGIPSKQQIDKLYTIKLSNSLLININVIGDSVRAYDNNEVSKNKDGENEAERIFCPPGSSVTKATIIVDVDINHLKPIETVEIIENLGKHLNVPSSLFRIFPVVKSQSVDSSALVGGQGEVEEMQTDGTSLQWEVGCGYVQPYHMPVLQQVESSSRDGSMGMSLGHKVVSWHVTNNRPSPGHSIKRMKRRTRKQHNRRRQHYQNDKEEEEEEGSGFWSKEPPIVEPKPGTTSPEIKPTKTTTTYQTPTHKPRPEKTTGRHHHHSTKPTPPTDEIIPTTPIISPTKTVYTPLATSTLEMVKSTTTATTTISTTSLPKIVDVSTTTTQVTPSLSTVSSTIVTAAHIPTEPTDNEAPKVKHPIKKIEVQVGNVLEYRIPSRTFHDEDGNTRFLKLRMLTESKDTLLNTSWVQLDEKSQTILGMPLEMHVGTYKYVLLAVDRMNKIGTDNFEIQVVKKQSSAPLSHEFSIKLDLDFDRFIYDASQRVDVTEKLASVYGDRNMSKITITKLSRGSVDFAWINNSLPTDTCPDEEIKHLVSFLVHENNTLNENFVRKMSPYKVLGAGVAPKEKCIEKGVVATTPVYIPTPEEPKFIETSEDDQFITTIVPVVVVTAMLLIAAIVICCLYHRKRKDKLADEGNSTFITKKGIPVIFADELEESPDPPTKPLIMSEEKPPLPPPEYPRSNSGGSLPSTPRSGHREPLLEGYNRPPPVSSSAGRRLPQTPNYQQQQRQPPPYGGMPP